MTVALNIGTRTSAEHPEDLKGRYLVSLKLIERLHRLLLDVIKDEFERLGRSDVNSVQALLLYNIGDAELTAGELTTSGPTPTAGRCACASRIRAARCATW